MRPAKMLIGLIIFIFCLALSISTPVIFSLSREVEDLIQVGFIGLGISCLYIGLME